MLDITCDIRYGFYVRANIDHDVCVLGRKGEFDTL